jgi:predicted HicB family RNase H-like nuclease
VPSLAGDPATPYRISLTRTGEAPDAHWLAEVDGMPAASARGSTPEEAMQRAWAAVDNASDSQVHRENATPPAAATPRHSGRLLVRMPATLHDELARAAEAEGVSLNQLITGVLAGAVEWRGTGEKSTSARRGATEDTQSGEPPLSTQLTRGVLAANLVVVLVAGVAAVALLAAAWRAGF